MSKVFVKGNIAIGKAAIAAGCRFYIGYPITPQNDVPEYFSSAMVEVGGIFLQGESEIASANILWGASLGGVRAMTSTSGPGFSLMAEGMSFMTGAEVPAVLVDVARPGPGMGGIDASQEDYFFAVKAPGNGGGRAFVWSPASVQELVDLVYKSFDIADKYLTPVIVLTDAIVGQTMEVVEFPPDRDAKEIEASKYDWKITTRLDDDFLKRKFSHTMEVPPQNQQKLCDKLAAKYETWEKEETQWEEFMLDDAEFVIFAYGSTSRTCKTAVRTLRAEGIKAGLFRPITLFPFPVKQIRNLDYSRIKNSLDVEASSYGMMLEDVQRSVEGQVKVNYYGKGGGVIIRTSDIVKAVKEVLGRS